jgi:gliding motility-associated-like protein
MPFHENFDCRKKDTIVIGASSSLPNTEFLWTGPGGFTSSKKDTFVSLPGVYQLRTIGINGCVSVDSVTIIYDTIPPTWSYCPVDTLSCANDSVDLIVRSDSEMASIAFDAPEGRLVNDSTWRTGQPGWILTLVEGENACVNIDSIEIQIDTIRPQMFLTGGSLTCDELRVRINAQVGPAGGVIQWSGPGNFNANQYDPLVASPGWYTAEYELGNGCIVTDSVLVTSEIDPPEVIVNDGILPCDGNSITLVVSSDTSGVEFNWTGPRGFRFNGPEPEVNLTGQYIVIVTGSNGCQTIDTIIVDQASNNTLLNLIADTISCIDPTVRIDANSDKDSLTFSWQGPGGFYDNGQQIDISLGGWYFISATDSLGCQAIDSIYVETDTSVARINIQSEASLGCNNDTTKLVALFQGDISNSEWYWLDSSGNPFGIGQDSVTVTRPGEYLIVLENKANGCQRRDTIVVATSNGGLDVMVEGVEPTCPGRSDGILMITSIHGNTGPWEVNVNGNAEGSETQISGLPPGDYRISLEDSAGCTWDSTITLMRPDTLWVQLGPDRTIDLGSSVNLNPLVNPGASGVRVIRWEPEDPLCPLCLTRQVAPNSSTRYSLTIEDDRGCSAMDDVLITIRSRTGIFLPNAFTPNDDGVNDSWIISVNEGISRINSLQIYDRWGNLVHSLRGIQVTDGLSLWDGTANGKELNPGVFVYSLTYETTNGTKAHLSGDITLIR